jgi:hypothetical protein
MANEVTTSVLPSAVDTSECYIVVAPHSKEWWRGPFPTKEQAQREAMQWMLERQWQSVSVFQFVGAVSKPMPELDWHEPAPKKADT